MPFVTSVGHGNPVADNRWLGNHLKEDRHVKHVRSSCHVRSGLRSKVNQCSFPSNKLVIYQSTRFGVTFNIPTTLRSMILTNEAVFVKVNKFD